jgi:hypothetical protein
MLLVVMLWRMDKTTNGAIHADGNKLEFRGNSNLVVTAVASFYQSSN